jgi:hypothetical protein
MCPRVVLVAPSNRATNTVERGRVFRLVRVLPSRKKFGLMNAWVGWKERPGARRQREPEMKEGFQAAGLVSAFYQRRSYLRFLSWVFPKERAQNTHSGNGHRWAFVHAAPRDRLLSPGGWSRGSDCSTRLAPPSLE